MEFTANHGMISASARDLRPFVLHRPTTVDDALRALADGGSGTIPYAGGVDLVAAFREGLDVDGLVWLKGIPELTQITRDGDELLIGAGVTHHQGVTDPEVQTVPGFAECWARIATVRVRYWGTIGGNLMARRTRYEMAILLSALDARLRIVEPGGTHDVAARDLFSPETGRPELLTQIVIPVGSRTRLDYERSLRPMVTQAFGMQSDGAGGLSARAVIATEYLQPVTLAVDPTAGSPDEICETTFAALPDDYADAAVSNAYLRHVGKAFLKRQLARTGAVS